MGKEGSEGKRQVIDNGGSAILGSQWREMSWWSDG